MKIVVIDDHPLVIKGISSILSIEKDIEVVGCASEKNVAINMIIETSPDISLVDLRLGNCSGFDVVNDAKLRGAGCKFVVLTSSEERDDFIKAERYAVDGYILKDAQPEELVYALRLIHKGRKYYAPNVLDFLLNENEKNTEIDALTAREKEVLKALATGLDNKEIAENLYITKYTVKKHISQILAKLRLKDRTQAALYANKYGVV